MQPSSAGWRQILSPEYIPNPLLFREDQLSMLQRNIDDDFPEGKYLEGRKSSGKSTTLKRHLTEVTKHADHAVIYVCSDRAILQGFQRALEKTLKRKLHFQESMFSALQEIPQKHIHLALDDAQQIVTYKGFNPFLKQVYESCLDSNKKLHLYCAGIISYPQFMRHIADDVQSRFAFKPILFSFYEADEIRYIIEQRLLAMGVSMDEEASKFIAAKIRSLISDLRLGFDILKNAIEAAPTETLTIEVIKHAWDRTKNEYWKQQLRRMEEPLRELVFAATLAAKQTNPQKMLVEGKEELIITAQIVTEYYRQYCKLAEVQPLYKQRLTFAFRRLEDMGWLTQIEQKSKGRYGLDVIYTYEMNPETVTTALRELAYSPFELPEVAKKAREQNQQLFPTQSILPANQMPLLPPKEIAQPMLQQHQSYIT